MDQPLCVRAWNSTFTSVLSPTELLCVAHTVTVLPCVDMGWGELATNTKDMGVQVFASLGKSLGAEAK